MRKIRLCLVRLLTISVVYLVLNCVFSNSVWTQDTKRSNARIKELQQQRLALLQSVREGIMLPFRSVRASFEEYQSAERDLLMARIVCAETPEDRIRMIDETLVNAQREHEVVKSLVEFNRVSGLTLLKSQSFLLELELLKEKELIDK